METERISYAPNMPRQERTGFIPSATGQGDAGQSAAGAINDWSGSVLAHAPPTTQQSRWNFDHYIQPIIEFVRVHKAWAAPIVFALCFAELLAFISLLIPAWAALVGIGALISASGLNFWPIWIAGSLGAALGDWLSYWIGLKLENRVYHMWPLSQHPDLIPKGEAFIEKWGALAIFIGRFSGPLARVGAADRRRLRHAVLAIPGRQFQLGLRVGGGAADARRHHLDDDQMARPDDRQLKKLCRELLPRQSAMSDGLSENYFSAATPACEITSSCEPVPPLTPIAPMILPPTISGLPPREAITSSSVGR